MWYTRQRFRQPGPILFFFSLIVSAGLILQLKTWFMNHQKAVRVEEYQEQVHKLTHAMKTIEAVANKSQTILKTLERTVKAQKFKDMQKIS